MCQSCKTIVNVVQSMVSSITRIKGVNFQRNCGTSCVGGLKDILVLSTEFSDNVNWPP